MERSALDAQQITRLRESMGRARRAAKSAEVLGAWGEFDRAAQEHADADSRASAAHLRMPVRAGSRTRQVSRRDRPGPKQLPRLIAEHKNSADTLVQSRRVRRELLTQYSGLLTGMDMRVRTSIEQAENLEPCRCAEPLLEVRAQLDAVRAAFATRGSFDGRELDTVRSPVRSEPSRRRCASGRRVATVRGSGLVPRDDRRRAGADHTRVALFRTKSAAWRLSTPSRGNRASSRRCCRALPRGAPRRAAAGVVDTGVRAATETGPTAPWWRG
jgi:hypothetical protein